MNIADFFSIEHVPLLKFFNSEIVRRSAEEIAADRASLPKPGPTFEEQTAMNSAAIVSIMKEMQRRR